VLAVFGKGIEAVDLAAFFIRAGVAVCRHDNGKRVVIGPCDVDLVEAMFGAGQQQVERLPAEAHHQALALWVAKTHVVFHQARLAVFDHQANKKNAFKGGAAFGHLGHRRGDDLIKRLLRDRFRHNRGR